MGNDYGISSLYTVIDIVALVIDKLFSTTPVGWIFDAVGLIMDVANIIYMAVEGGI